MDLTLLKAGLAGNQSSSVFQININGKLYSYTGNYNEIYSLEELVVKTLSKISADFLNTFQQIIVISPYNISLLTINDNIDSFDGEDTISYSLKDFKSEEILQLLQDFIIDPSEVILFNLSEEKIIVSREKDSISEEFNLINIGIDKHISNGKKIKLLLNKHKWSIFLLLFTLIVPLGIKFGSEFYIEEKLYPEKSKLKIINNKIKKEKSKIEKEVKGFAQKYNNYEKEKDFLENEKEINKFINEVRF